jgi:glycosyltransferase involved in cell wall biosynthesis
MIDRLAIGGTENRLMSLIKGLDRSKVTPFLCLLDGSDPVSQSLEPACCPVLRLNVRSLRQPRALGRAWQFWRFLRRERIDAVQLIFPDSTYFGALVARCAGVPRIVGSRFNQNYWMNANRRKVARFFNRYLISDTVTNCEASRRAVIEDDGAVAETVVVIENGSDLSRFRPADSMVRVNSPARIGVVASLSPVKNLDVFIRAARIVLQAHPDAVFEIAGEGRMRSELQRLADELAISDKVKLLGQVSDVATFLGTLDVAVLCSSSEGMSNSLLEYMAAGKAIVATEVGGTPELVAHESEALLVPPGDEAALAQAMMRLLQDRRLAAELSISAQHKSRQYSVEVMTQRYEQYFLNLVRTSGGSQRSNLRRHKVPT